MGRYFIYVIIITLKSGDLKKQKLEYFSSIKLTVCNKNCHRYFLAYDTNTYILKYHYYN